MWEQAWVWITRVCAVGTLIYLMIFVGFERTPSWAFILLIGLFFGPDALKGGLQMPWGRKGE